MPQQPPGGVGRRVTATGTAVDGSTVTATDDWSVEVTTAYDAAAEPATTLAFTPTVTSP